jgi:excisionase family DNA binding protein
MLSLLKPSDVARSLGVSRAWVYDAAKCGRIPSVRIGGEDGPLRFVPADLERWIEQARAGWTPSAGMRRSAIALPEKSRPHAGRGRSAPAAQQSLL